MGALSLGPLIPGLAQARAYIHDIASSQSGRVIQGLSHLARKVPEDHLFLHLGASSTTALPLVVAGIWSGVIKRYLMVARDRPGSSSYFIGQALREFAETYGVETTLLRVDGVIAGKTYPESLKRIERQLASMLPSGGKVSLIESIAAGIPKPKVRMPSMNLVHLTPRGTLRRTTAESATKEEENEIIHTMGMNASSWRIFLKENDLLGPESLGISFSSSLLWDQAGTLNTAREVLHAFAHNWQIDNGDRLGCHRIVTLSPTVSHAWEAMVQGLLIAVAFSFERMARPDSLTFAEQGALALLGLLQPTYHHPALEREGVILGLDGSDVASQWAIREKLDNLQARVPGDFQDEMDEAASNALLGEIFGWPSDWRKILKPLTLPKRAIQAIGSRRRLLTDSSLPVLAMHEESGVFRVPDEVRGKEGWEGSLSMPVRAELNLFYDSRGEGVSRDGILFEQKVEWDEERFREYLRLGRSQVPFESDLGPGPWGFAYAISFPAIHEALRSFVQEEKPRGRWLVHLLEESRIVTSLRPAGTYHVKIRRHVGLEGENGEKMIRLTRHIYDEKGRLVAKGRSLFEMGGDLGARFFEGTQGRIGFAPVWKPALTMEMKPDVIDPYVTVTGDDNPFYASPRFALEIGLPDRVIPPMVLWDMAERLLFKEITFRVPGQEMELTAPLRDPCHTDALEGRFFRPVYPDDTLQFYVTEGMDGSGVMAVNQWNEMVFLLLAGNEDTDASRVVIPQVEAQAPEPPPDEYETL